VVCRSRDHQRNVDLALKKLDLRIWIKTATDAGEKMTNVEERAVGSMEKPRQQGSGFGWDKSYMTTDKTSRDVRRTKGLAASAKINIKERGGKR
jgi:hypothetical protein